MMKATKYFMILLAVVALFAFACKTDKVEEEEVQPEPTPVEQWITDITAFLETWEAKTEFTTEDVEAMTEQLQPLGEKVEELDLENTTEGEQKELVEGLLKRVDELMNKVTNLPMP